MEVNGGGGWGRRKGSCHKLVIYWTYLVFTTDLWRYFKLSKVVGCNNWIHYLRYLNSVLSGPNSSQQQVTEAGSNLFFNIYGALHTTTSLNLIGSMPSQRPIQTRDPGNTHNSGRCYCKYTIPVQVIYVTRHPSPPMYQDLQDVYQCTLPNSLGNYVQKKQQQFDWSKMSTKSCGHCTMNLSIHILIISISLLSQYFKLRAPNKYIRCHYSTKCINND